MADFMQTILSRFDQLESRFDNLDSRLAKLEALDARLAKVEARGAAVHRELGGLRRELNAPDPGVFQKNGVRIPCSTDEQFKILESKQEVEAVQVEMVRIIYFYYIYRRNLWRQRHPLSSTISSILVRVACALASTCPPSRT